MNGNNVGAPDQVLFFVDCVYEPADIVEVRMLGHGRKAKSVWYQASELAKHASHLKAHNRKGLNIYVGALARKRKGGSTATDVALARVLFADFDNCTLEEASRRWGIVGVPNPTVVILSGHGVHVYWRLAEPMADLAKWTAIQKQLIAVLGSDASIHDPPRIMRLPGFLNVKREPHVPCTIVEQDPRRRYSLAQLVDSLQRFAEQGNGHLPETKKPKAVTTPEGIIADGERNRTLTSRAGVMRRAGMAEGEILPAIAAINRDRCRPMLPDAELKRIAQSVSRYAPAGKSQQKAIVAIERYRAFPVDVLPDVVRRFVTECADAIGCDRSFVALPMLGCLARAIGSRRVIRLKATWHEPAIIWAAIVGKSGTHKSPAIKAVMRPLMRTQADAEVAFQDAMRRYVQEKAQYEVNLEAWKSQQRKNAKKGQPDERDQAPWEPLEPVYERFIVCDITIEALADRLADQYDGVLLVRDELAGWIGGIAEYKGGRGSDNGHWLATWSAEPVTVDRKTGGRKIIHVPRAAVSIVGGIQPGTLRRAIGREHMQDGLCARLLLAMPDPKPVTWSEAIVSPDTSNALEDLLEQLLTMEPAADADGRPEPYPIPLGNEAKRLWVDYFNRHRAEQADLDEDLAAAWSKLEAYTARFALIFTLCRNPGAATIDAQSMADAITLSDWFGGEARRVYGVLAEDDEGRDERELIEWIERRGGELTVRQLQQGRRDCRTADEAEAKLQRLVEAGAGVWSPVPTSAKGGQPTRVFRLYAPSTVYGIPPNTNENVSSVDVDTLEDSETEVTEWTG